MEHKLNLNIENQAPLLFESLLNTTKCSIHSLLLAVKNQSDLTQLKEVLNNCADLIEDKEDLLEDEDLLLEGILREAKNEERFSHDDILKDCFKNSIKKIRESKSISQLELAKLLNKNASEVSRWESGGVIPSMKNIILISKALNCSLDSLIK